LCLLGAVYFIPVAVRGPASLSSSNTSDVD